MTHCATCSCDRPVPDHEHSLAEGATGTPYRVCRCDWVAQTRSVPDNAALREALEWYADRHNYQFPVIDDNGTRARAALAPASPASTYVTVASDGETAVEVPWTDPKG